MNDSLQPQWAQAPSLFYLLLGLPADFGQMADPPANDTGAFCDFSMLLGVVVYPCLHGYDIFIFPVYSVYINYIFMSFSGDSGVGVPVVEFDRVYGRPMRVAFQHERCWKSMAAREAMGSPEPISSLTC